MAVILETSLGDLTIDLYSESCPITCKNFLKLSKIKYYNNCLFFNIQKNFIVQTGDPTNTGKGGDSIYGLLYGEQAKYFEDEIRPHLKHTKLGTVSMANAGENMNTSQFFITVSDGLHQLDGKHTVFGQVSEGLEILEKINDAYTDEEGRPLQVIRIRHTIVLDDPFPDPSGLEALIPDRSPIPPKDQWADLLDEEEIEKLGQKDERPLEEIEAEQRKKEARSRAEVLEIIGDIPDVDVKPPDNVLFVCKLNPATGEEDLELIFSRFGEIKKCEVIRDWKTNESLSYAFIEFVEHTSCEQAYHKMENVLIDDRRIHVDFSQSVSKQAVDKNGRLINTWGFWKKHQQAALAKAKSDGKSLGDLELKESRKGDGYSLVFDDDHADKKSRKRKPADEKDRSHKYKESRRDESFGDKDRSRRDKDSSREQRQYSARDKRDKDKDYDRKRRDKDRDKNDSKRDSRDSERRK